MNAKTTALFGLAAMMFLGATFQASAQTPGGRMGREKHPEMRAALKALQNAKNRLEHAAHDYKGHRVKAIEHTNEAIREVEEAIASDRR